MKESFENYNDFYIKISNDLSVDCKYTGKTGEEQIKSEQIDKDNIKDIEDLLIRVDKEPKFLNQGKIEELGRLVYEGLFVGKVKNIFEGAFKEIDEPKFGLKILLDIAPIYSGFPWEAIYYGDKFLATYNGTPFFRIHTGEKLKPITLDIGKNPRVLSILSNPENLPGVDIKGEGLNLKNIILHSRSKKYFGGYKDIVEELRDKPDPKISGNPSLHDMKTFFDIKKISGTAFNIIHFCSHGSFNYDKDKSAISMEPTKEDKSENKNIRVIEASGKDLVNKLDEEYSIGLIVLNACNSGSILKSVKHQGLVPELLNVSPAVVAMRDTIGKGIAKEFTFHFYKHFNIQNWEVAIQEARDWIKENYQNTLDFTIPLFYLGCQEKSRIPVIRIFDRIQPNIPQYDRATNLNPAGETITKLLELHDKSIHTESKWKELITSEDDKTWIIHSPPDNKHLIEHIFNEFNNKLDEINELIDTIFPNYVKFFKDNCMCLEKEKINIAKLVKIGVENRVDKKDIKTASGNWRQKIGNFEHFISYVVSTKMEDN